MVKQFVTRKACAAAWIKRIGVVSYALLCALFIIVVSGKDYEWMVGEKEANGSMFTHCMIPLSMDDTADVTKPLTFFAIVVLPIFGLVRLIKRRQVGLSLVLGFGLLLLWAYRFWGRTWFCPG